MTNDILSLDQIKEGLKHKRLYLVGQATGLSYPTLQKLAKGEDHNFTIDTLRSVSEYIKGETSNLKGKHIEFAVIDEATEVTDEAWESLKGKSNNNNE